MGVGNAPVSIYLENCSLDKDKIYVIRMHYFFELLSLDGRQNSFFASISAIYSSTAYPAIQKCSLSSIISLPIADKHNYCTFYSAKQIEKESTITII